MMSLVLRLNRIPRPAVMTVSVLSDTAAPSLQDGETYAACSLERLTMDAHRIAL
jgi:hypothetical protein